MPDPDERRYQIFVSSTFRDLERERQRVLQAILEMRAFPAGMELFPSADDEQWEFIKKEIASSDYYVVVVAGKYGSLAPDGVSFTEKEYDYAVETGKPVMGFIFHELGELKGSVLEADEQMRSKLVAFRSKVAKGKLIKYYRNPDDLKALVFQAIAHAFQFRPQTGWIRARAARRLEDLEQIADLQKQVIKLTSENSALRDAASDKREKLSQENDRVEWTVSLGWFDSQGKTWPEENAQFTFGATWNELFIGSFREKNHSIHINRANGKLRELIVFGARQAGFEDRFVIETRGQLSDLEWLKLTQRAVEEAEVSPTEIRTRYEPSPLDGEIVRIRRDVQLQLQALGYIDIDYHNGHPVAWTLTNPRGVVHLGLLLGVVRGHEQIPSMGDSAALSD